MAPLALCLVGIELLALSFTGWHLGPATVSEQIRSDTPALVAAAAAGALAGAVAVLGSWHRAPPRLLVLGVLVGALPVLVRLVSYVTDAF